MLAIHRFLETPGKRRRHHGSSSAGREQRGNLGVIGGVAAAAGTAALPTWSKAASERPRQPKTRPHSGASAGGIYGLYAYT